MNSLKSLAVFVPRERRRRKQLELLLLQVTLFRRQDRNQMSESMGGIKKDRRRIMMMVLNR